MFFVAACSLWLTVFVQAAETAVAAVALEMQETLLVAVVVEAQATCSFLPAFCFEQPVPAFVSVALLF